MLGGGGGFIGPMVLVRVRQGGCPVPRMDLEGAGSWGGAPGLRNSSAARAKDSKTIKILIFKIDKN